MFTIKISKKKRKSKTNSKIVISWFEWNYMKISNDECHLWMSENMGQNSKWNKL